MTALRLTIGAQPEAGVRVIERRAVRAVVPRHGRLLMVHSTVAGDYKFPGGGIRPGASDEQALAREVLEECGHRIASFGAQLGVVVEFRPAWEPGHMMRMVSAYVVARVDDQAGPTELDDYEAELGLAPVWVSVAEASATNHRVLAAGRAHPWVTRETAILDLLERGGLLND